MTERAQIKRTDRADPLRRDEPYAPQIGIVAVKRGTMASRCGGTRLDIMMPRITMQDGKRP